MDKCPYLPLVCVVSYSFVPGLELPVAEARLLPGPLLPLGLVPGWPHQLRVHSVQVPGERFALQLFPKFDSLRHVTKVHLVGAWTQLEEVFLLRESLECPGHGRLNGVCSTTSIQFNKLITVYLEKLGMS